MGSMYVKSNLFALFEEGRELLFEINDVNKMFNEIHRIRYQQFVDVETPPPEKGKKSCMFLN